MKPLIVILTGVIASSLLISASVTKPQDAVKSIPCACDDAKRYDANETAGGGAIIATETACGMIKTFEQKTGANRGGFISKKVLDSIFCNKSMNGISYYFGMETVGEKRTVKLIIEGAHLNTTKVGALGSGTAQYVNETMCPPSCGMFSDRCRN